MSLSLDSERLASAVSVARRGLLADRGSRPYWSGHISSSPLATATSISALMLAEQHVDDDVRPNGLTDTTWLSGVLLRTELNELVKEGLNWLAAQQNGDGGWGDCDGCPSNVATTLSVQATFQLTGVPARYSRVLEDAHSFVQRAGGALSLRKCAPDNRLLAAAVLSHCAHAGLVPWRKVPTPYSELALLPADWCRRLGSTAPSWSSCLANALARARHHHAPGSNPLVRCSRWIASQRGIESLETEQGADGGFLESLPVTAFTVMNLASIGLADHVVVRRGIEYLLSHARGDGSWPLGSPQSTWNASCSALALGWDFHEEPVDAGQPAAKVASAAEETLDWLLSQQWRPIDCRGTTKAGAWSRHGLGYGLPAADASAQALLALAAWRRRWPQQRADDVYRSALSGCDWLLELQNTDGGWPIFLRGCERVDVDASGPDMTALALSALETWRHELSAARSNPDLAARIEVATSAGLQYLMSVQHVDGGWSALWAGSPTAKDAVNRVLGTSGVLRAMEDLGRGSSEAARRGALWLANAKHPSGGWGPLLAEQARKNAFRHGEPTEPRDDQGTIEETSAAVRALLPLQHHSEKAARAVELGSEWLCAAMLGEKRPKAAPVSYDFTRLWYYDRSAPLQSATAALLDASAAVHPHSQSAATSP